MRWIYTRNPRVAASARDLRCRSVAWSRMRRSLMLEPAQCSCDAGSEHQNLRPVQGCRGMIRVDQRTVECGWGGGGNEPIYQPCMRRFQRKIRRTCWGATVLPPQTAEPSNCEGSTRYIRPTRSSGIVFRIVLTKARAMRRNTLPSGKNQNYAGRRIPLLGTRIGWTPVASYQ